MEEQSATLTPSPDNQPRPRYRIQYTPASQLGILIGMAFVGMIVGNVLAMLLFLAKDHNLSHLMATMTDPSNTNLMRLAQIIGTFFTFLFPIWLFLKIVHPPVDFLHVKKKSDGRIWILVALLAFVSLPVTDLMGVINRIIPIPVSLARIFQKMEDSYNDQVMQLMQMKNVSDLIISLFLVALLPAIFEETFFRGGLQNILIAWFKKPFWAILTTAVVFSAIHFSYYGFLPRAFLGLVLGYVYYWTKDLKMNILVHFINNAISVVSFYTLAQRHELTPEKMNESLPWYYQVGGLALFVFVAWRLKRLSAVASS
ncbi:MULTISPECIES: CPBP family intramembrane glutamic endopeptidase [Chitinophagaceae]